MAGITGIFAQIRIVLPWTPVPITGQVLAVLLSGIFLGNLYGGLSMALYLILGFAGIPWFSGGTSGFFIGPTTGYLIGFIPAALFIGWAFRRATNYMVQIGSMLAAIAIIYFLGTCHFIFFTKIGLKQALIMTVVPFIPFDIIKGVIAASIGRLITIGQAHTGS